MKVFDIEKAKEGAAVCTRDGREVRILCMDRICNNGMKIIALVKDKDGLENMCCYPETGKFMCGDETNSNDLMMATNKKKMWANVYKIVGYFYPGSYLYDDKNRAEKSKKSVEDYIGTFEIEVEV